jgi:hypothetical protein
MNYLIPFTRSTLYLLSVFFITQACSPVNKKEQAFKQATLLCNALVEDDCETIYTYNLPPSGQKSSKEQFMIDCEKFSNDGRELQIGIKKIELSPILRMVHCKGTYQCVLKRKTIYEGSIAPREMFVVGLSEDGENWKFDISMHLDFDNDKKIMPWLCNELYN